MYCSLCETPLEKKIAPSDEQKGQYIFVSSPLISQNIRLSELAPFQLSSNDDYSLAGCRGIAGPFPPPLWIRAPCGAVELCPHNIMVSLESQLCRCPDNDTENKSRQDGHRTGMDMVLPNRSTVRGFQTNVIS